MGSPQWTNEATVRKALEKAVVNQEQWKVILVHGGDTPTDNIAADIAKEFNWSVEEVKAQWGRHLPDCPQWHKAEPTCPRAGPERNKRMVARGADICVAFIKAKNHGASEFVMLAERRGIPVILFEED